MHGQGATCSRESLCVTRPYLRELGSRRLQLPVRVAELLQHAVERVNGRVGVVAQPQAVHMCLQWVRRFPFGCSLYPKTPIVLEIKWPCVDLAGAERAVARHSNNRQEARGPLRQHGREQVRVCHVMHMHHRTRKSCQWARCGLKGVLLLSGGGSKLSWGRGPPMLWSMWAAWNWLLERLSPARTPAQEQCFRSACYMCL